MHDTRRSPDSPTAAAYELNVYLLPCLVHWYEAG